MRREHPVLALAIGLLALASLASGCGGDAPPVDQQQTPALTKIELAPATASVPVGRTAQLSVVGTWSDGTTSDVSDEVTWTTAAPAIAVVNGSGLVTGLSQGLSAVLVQKGTLTTSATVTVTPAVASSLAFDVTSVAIDVGTDAQLAITGTFSDTSTKDVSEAVTWTTSNQEVASVSAGGLVFGASLGTTTITAKLDEAEASVTVTVVEAHMVSLELRPAGLTLAKGRVGYFDVIAHLSNETQIDVTSQVAWSTSVDGVVSIEAGGGVTAVGEGQVTVTAKVGGLEGEALVEVGPADLIGLILWPETRNLAHGLSITLEVIGRFSDETSAPVDDLSWSSDETSVATVDAQGVVTAVAEGTATVTAKQGDLEASVEITVTPAVLTRLKISPETASLPKGRFFDVSLVTVMSNGVEAPVDTDLLEWSSSDYAVAQSNGNLRIFAYDVGTATVTAEFQGLSASVEVTVTEKVLESLAVVPGNPLLMPGGHSVTVTVDGIYSDRTTVDLTDEVTWENESDAVVTVDNGKVTSVALGASIISVSARGLEATTTARVFDGRAAYVGERRYQGKVTVIDPNTHTVLTEIPTPRGAPLLVTHASLNWIYVAADFADELFIIDRRTSRMGPAGPNVGGTIDHMKLSADGSRLYLRTSAGALKFIDTATNNVERTVTVPYLASFFLDEEAGLLYAGGRNFSDGDLTAIDLATGEVVGTPLDVDGATAMFRHPTLDRAWVHNHPSNEVTVIKPSTLTVEGTIALDWAAISPRMSRNGEKLYLSQQYGSTLAVISTATDAVVKTVDLGFNIDRIWALEGLDRLYIAGDQKLAVFNTLNDTVINIHAIGGGYTYGLAENATFDVAYLPMDSYGNLHVFNRTSGALLKTVKVPQYSSSVLFTVP